MFLINGLFSESISAQDRGLHYGDGVFETIALQNSRPLCWDAHYQRLHMGCNRLQMQCPPMELLSTEIQRLPVTHPCCVVKILVTRGCSGRGYRPPQADTTHTRILGLYPWPEFPPEHAVNGVNTRICTTRLGQNPQLAGIKHLNRLEQVLARAEWDDPAVAEGLMLDTCGAVIEGTMSNLFCIKDDALMTPDLSSCGIAGVIRGAILELSAQLGMQARTVTLTEPELYAADEIFLCNSVIGIWPVRCIGQKVFAVGNRTREIRHFLLRQEMIAA